MSKSDIFILITIGLVLGFALGILTQQAMTQATIVKALSAIENFEVNIDLNETKIIEGTREIAEEMIAAMKEVKILAENDSTVNETWRRIE